MWTRYSNDHKHLYPASTLSASLLSALRVRGPIGIQIVLANNA